MKRWILWSAVAAGFATALLLATDVWPGLRGPENWRWERRFFGSPMLLVSAALFASSMYFALRFARADAAEGRVRRTVRGGAFAALLFAQMLTLSAAEPGGLANVARRVESPTFTSYDSVARTIQDPRDFLRRYHVIQRSFPVHGPSQPPGRVLYFWSMRRAFGDERGPAIAGFSLMAIGALAAIPLFVLVGGRRSPGAVSAAALLLCCLPSYLLFTPETDHLILFLSLGAAALAVEALRHASLAFAPGLAFASGIVAGLGAFVSFTSIAAFGIWGIAALGMVALARRRASRAVSASEGMRLVLAGLGGVVSVVGLVAAAGMDWPAVFRECVAAARHVQVEIHGREYSTWVTWNLADFALFLGPPLAVVCMARVFSEWRDLGTELPAASALLVGLFVLDISGVILGETGRIWMFLMPLAVAAIASEVRDAPGRLVPVAIAQFVVVLAERAFLDVPG